MKIEEWEQALADRNQEHVPETHLRVQVKAAVAGAQEEVRVQMPRRRVLVDHAAQ
jgi:hypothetical protein